MYELSIIVPLLGELTKFEDTLASVLHHRPMHSQVIVPHDGQYHDPHDLQNDVDFVSAKTTRNLAGFLNAGISAVQGSVTVCVRPGIEIDELWELPVIHAFRDNRVGAVTPIIVSETCPSKIVAAGVTTDRAWIRKLAGRGSLSRNISSANVCQYGPTSWLAAWRTSALKLLTPLDEKLDTVYVDLDIALSMAGLGYMAVMDPDFVGTVESENEIIVDSASPHWTSAQRARIRHGHLMQTSRTEVNLMEADQRPRPEWKFRHLFQRFNVWKSQKSDEQFRARLQLNRQFSQTPESSRSISESLRAPRRQAA